MRILIADDQTKRYGPLIDQLIAKGIARNDINVVPCANDARDKLEKFHYDLLVLDVLLPLWSDEEADVKHSQDLLFELHNSDLLKRPRKILGITGDISLLSEAKARFEETTWSVLAFSESNTEWSSSILASVDYLQKIEDAAEVEHVDVAVVCALRSPELDQVLKLPWAWQAAEPIDDHTFIHRGSFESGGTIFSVAAASAPRMGMVASALLSSRLIAALKPKMIAMCGICAGVRDKTAFGDVLVVDPAWDSQSGKRIRDGEVSILAMAPHQLQCTPRIRSHLEQIRDDQPALLEIFSDFEGAPSVPKILVGPVATGSAVLADANIVSEIKIQHRNLLGVEMESYGVYAAATEAAVPQPSFVALKSVCDFADPQKGDAHQRYAAYTSARVFRLLMERFGMRLLNG
jgi:nucleoside phosphorylase